MTNQINSKIKDKNQLNLTAQVEALLFVSPEPVSPHQLGAALEVTARRIEICLDELVDQYEGRGIRVQWYDGKVQLTSAPEAAQLIEYFLNLEATSILSRAALETISIIAYQQPITRPQIDAIRGVNSDGVLRGLLSKGLVEDVGRAEGPGRPILYSATSEFLKHFGLTSLDELPPLKLEDVAVEENENGSLHILKE
ncbi:MAG: SMC-Scp complex subunit ScpB [Anaerolineaceae bacterium 4572_5.1]|nr:MAG: SMC-Scp complex subunit ScpB [Anaerolineaceae bacterium 4572_5.1]